MKTPIPAIDKENNKVNIKISRRRYFSYQLRLWLFYAVFIKRRIKCVEILFVEFIGCEA